MRIGVVMIVLQVLWLGILLLAIPTWIGAIFVNVDKSTKNLPFRWISGQIVLWAGFQLICVPLVLKQESFLYVVFLFIGYTVGLLLLATVLYFRRKKTPALHLVKEPEKPKSKWYYLGWGVFWALLLFQLVQAVVMTYGDGDDAFYIGEATYVVDGETMYSKIPYNGFTTELDVRHGMAPFPIWIAYLSKLTGIRTVSVAHVLLPLALIPMTYGIYYLLANKFFAKKKESIPLFLIFTELLVLFGDYSFYTVENFMIARSRQGKAAMGSIIIPALFLLLLLLMEKLQESQKIPFCYWVLLASTLTAACLCTTLGALLTCMLVGVTGLCAAVCYRNWKVLFPMAACCIPCVVFAALYLILG